MTQHGHDCLTTGVALWATALVPSVVAAAGPPELQKSDAIAIVLGYKKVACRFGTTKYPKHAGATSATQFCNNRAPNSASESALGGCTAILGNYVAGDG